jgi:hypothetical protein
MFDMAMTSKVVEATQAAKKEKRTKGQRGEKEG